VSADRDAVQVLIRRLYLARKMTADEYCRALADLDYLRLDFTVRFVIAAAVPALGVPAARAGSLDRAERIARALSRDEGPCGVEHQGRVLAVFTSGRRGPGPYNAYTLPAGRGAAEPDEADYPGRYHR
jgi:hypothetical protein